MRIALLQIDVRQGEPQWNEAHVLATMRQAVVAHHPDVLVLPEMWNTGYALDRLATLGGLRTEAIHASMGQFAKEHGVHLVAGSISRPHAHAWYNTTFVYDREGTVRTSYDKVHLFRLMDEHRYLQPGNALGQTTLDGVHVGLTICYDLRFPELMRTLALQGAQVIFCVAQWPMARLAHWNALLRARAIENQVFIVACNRVGESGEERFGGHSQVISPWGDVLGAAADEEAIVVVDVDVDQCAHVRQQIPIFSDRRPDCYLL